MNFIYNSDGELVAFNYQKATYLYVKNHLGDVVGITGEAGNWLVKYYYGAWGSTFDIELNGENELYSLAQINPMRYRSYYCDTDLEMYYLQSRYYFSDWGRFLNADIPDIAQQSKDEQYGLNLFAYCGNDPVNNSDPTGYLAKLDAGLVLAIFLVYYLAPKKLSNKYIFKISNIAIDRTGLCIAKIKYYKNKFNKHSFVVTFGNKYDWGDKRNVNFNLNMNAVLYHAEYITEENLKSHTCIATGDAPNYPATYISAFNVMCYLISAHVTTAQVKKQYNYLWGDNGKDKNDKKKYVLFRITNKKSLNGWYYC